MASFPVALDKVIAMEQDKLKAFLASADFFNNSYSLTSVRVGILDPGKQGRTILGPN